MKKNLFLILSAVCSLSATAQTQFWGTAQSGGNTNDGTIFYSDGSGNFQQAWSFYQPDGKMPVGKMVLADNGKLYGETWEGGFGDSCVIFSYDPLNNIYTNIWDLYQYPAMGWGAYSGMIKGADGMLYGLCSTGGADSGGVIFKVNPWTDTYIPMFHFNCALDGCSPYGSLVQLSDGKLYGMTTSGGSTGNGVIFSYDPVANIYMRLYSFTGAGGRGPLYGSLLQASNGKLYGMTHDGGTADLGVIFSLDLSTTIPTYENLFNFNYSDGYYPCGSLAQAPNGLLYGMAYGGGTDSLGVLFSFDINTHDYSIVVNFNGLNGANPTRSVTVGSNGILYGITYGGGINGMGVAFIYNIQTNTYTKIHDFELSTTGSSPDCEIIETPVLTLAEGIPHTGNGSLNVFPNPVSNSLMVGGNGKEEIISFVDVAGRKLASVKTSSLTRTSVDVSGFPNIFFLRMQSGEVKKLVRN